MKQPLLIVVALCLAALPAVDAENAPAPAPVQQAPAQPPHLTTFDLAFPGGTPRQLVAAIEKASGKPLNAIVADDYADWALPPLTMSRVTVAELFNAMDRMVVTKYVGPYTWNSSGTFRTADQPRDINDRSVWYFVVQGNLPPTQTRYFLLSPYLRNGLTVDDITTAIQTGWKMRGEARPPKLSFHKETQLLIAFGDRFAVEDIDAVLHALEPTTRPAPAPAADKPAEKKQ